MQSDKPWYEQLEDLVKNQYADVYCDFHRDDEGDLQADNIRIYAGDCNCPHAHRYEPETGHGMTYVEEEWKAETADLDDPGDKGMSIMLRAIRRFREAQAEPIKCKECKKQLKEKKDGITF